MEPKTASLSEPLAGEDYFFQDKLIIAVPFQISPSLLAPFPLNIWEED